jgi:hypothetical protein
MCKRRPERRTMGGGGGGLEIGYENQARVPSVKVVTARRDAGDSRSRTF